MSNKKLENEEKISDIFTPISDNEDVKPQKIDRKQYSKDYYEKNKTVLLKKMLDKEKCKFCERMVCHQQLQKHQKSKYCKTRRLQKIEMLQEMKDHYRFFGQPADEHYDKLLEYMLKK